MLALGWLWALPNTALGLLLALVTRARPYAWRSGHWWWVGDRWPWTRFFRRYERDAFTIGALTLSDEEGKDDLALIRHEHAHVLQSYRWGILDGPAYWAASLWVWLHGKDPYLDNPFEVQARAAEEG